MTTRIEKLAAIITYLVARAPRPPGRTMLQKLIYLADVEQYRTAGHTISGLPFIAYDHGPWLRELYEALELAGGVRERRYFWRPDRPSYEYVYDDAAGADAEDLLTADERQVLDRIVATWGHQPLQTVLRHVYSSAPYEGTDFGDEVSFSTLDRGSVPEHRA